jgi:hypothetical protein
VKKKKVQNDNQENRDKSTEVVKEKKNLGRIPKTKPSKMANMD